MIQRLRNLKPGDRFILCRTQECYLLLRREHSTSSGTKWIVTKDGKKESSLHHSCHVEKIT